MSHNVIRAAHGQSGAPAAGLAALGYGALARMGFVGSGANRLSIMIFHRVLATPDPLMPYEVDARAFDALLGLLGRCFNVVPLGEGVRAMREGTLPPRAACITFDDGYADNAEVALPILQKHGMSATFFVATGFLDGGRMWNDTVIELVRAAPAEFDLRALGHGQFSLHSVADRQAAIGTLLGNLKYMPLDERLDAVAAIRAEVAAPLRENLMMRSEQVRGLHEAGMEIGGHTVNHPILARMDAAGAKREMADGKHALEAIIGAPVPLFAYPNGKPGQDYLAEHAAMAREIGFEAAVSTSWGSARPASDVFQLPRFTPWDRHPLPFLLRMIQNARRNGDTA